MRTLLLCTVAFIPSVALAQPEQPPPAADPTAHRHLGLLFRADLGPDDLTTSASDGGSNVSLKGPGAAVGIVVDGAVSEDWILSRARTCP